MRVARKFISVAAAAGLAVAGLAILPATPSGAAPVPVTLSCGGDDSVLAGSVGGAPAPSQDILDLLGSLATPPVTPPNYLAMSATVDATVPASLSVGESGEASFTASVSLPQSLIDTARSVGITTINVVNTTVSVDVVNGTGGPIVGHPPDAAIDISTDPVPFPTFGPFSTTVSPTTEGTNIIYNAGTVQFGASLSIPGLGELTMGLSCTVSGSPQVAQTMVTGTAPTSAAPATTAAPPPGANVVTAPKFTG